MNSLTTQSVTFSYNEEIYAKKNILVKIVKTLKRISK